jgi:hypothetical protein
MSDCHPRKSLNQQTFSDGFQLFSEFVRYQVVPNCFLPTIHRLNKIENIYLKWVRLIVNNVCFSTQTKKNRRISKDLSPFRKLPQNLDLHSVMHGATLCCGCPRLFGCSDPTLSVSV